MPKKVDLDLEDERFGLVLNCAVRYALMTPEVAAPVCKYLSPMLRQIGYKALWVMEQDIKNANKGEEEPWNSFAVEVRVAKNRRKP